MCMGRCVCLRVRVCACARLCVRVSNNTLQEKEELFTVHMIHIMSSYACHEDTWGNVGTAPHILNLSTRWMQLVSYTLWLLYVQGKSPQEDVMTTALVWML